MQIGDIFQQYLEHLFAGKRSEARELLMAAQDRGLASQKLLVKVIWPAMEQVERLYREHEISLLTQQMATRINRLIADQLQGLLAREPKTGQRMIVVCGDGEIAELGAQVTADLFEARGWAVWFVGSGVPQDEIVEFMGKIRPDCLCLYGTRPEGVPGLRHLVDRIRENGGFDKMQILVCGGVFNRAEGLAEEIRCDLHADTAEEAMKLLKDNPIREESDEPQPGRRRRRRRRRPTPGVSPRATAVHSSTG
jgi:methanogenic corrinoid protein MtbC1